MKFKLSELINFSRAIQMLNGKEYPTRCSLWLSRAEIKLQEPLLLFENTRKKLVEKYGVKDDSGNAKVADDKLIDFHREADELLASEEEIAIEPISINYFLDKDDADSKPKLSKDFFTAMDKLLKQD